MTEVTQTMKPRISQSSKQAFRNPWVLGWLATIVIVLMVNAGFIITAVATNPGLVDKNYYEKGRDLEREINTLRETRQRLGWKMQLDMAQKPRVNQAIRYTLSVVDKAGAPVDGERAVIQAYRPSDAASDFDTEMEKIAPGTYSVKLSFPLKGIWDIAATLHNGEDTLQITRRISVKAP